MVMRQEPTTNYYDKLIEWRDKNRKQKEEGLLVVKEKDLPLENNPQGLMRWYMHPAMDHISMNSMLVFTQEILPNSSSGKLKVQGGIVIYVWVGSGYSVLDGVRYDWNEGDVIQIPCRPDGVVVQHFCTHNEITAKLLTVEANFIDAIGVDRGAGFEQLQDAPTFRK